QQHVSLESLRKRFSGSTRCPLTQPSPPNEKTFGGEGLSGMAACECRAAVVATIERRAAITHADARAAARIARIFAQALFRFHSLPPHPTLSPKREDVWGRGLERHGGMRMPRCNHGDKRMPRC